MKFDLQKASLSKRLAAFLIDFLIFALVAVVLIPVLSVVCGLGSARDQYDAVQLEYEEKYDVEFGLSEREYKALSDADKTRYEEVEFLMKKDERFVNLYNKIIELALLTIVLSILLSFIVLEVILPLIFKNGQTLGKKFFGIGVMRVDGVRITHLQVFVRAILGKFTVETMFPLFLIVFVVFGVMGGIGTLIIIGIFIMQIVLMIATKTNSMIHDLFAVTTVIDVQTQMIFDTEADLIEYKKKIAEQKAIEQPY